MKKTCFYYWILKPLRERFKDSDCIQAWEIDISMPDNIILKMAFLMYSDMQPAALRFSLPEIEGQSVPEKYSNAIQQSKEHFLSVYRLNYDPDANFTLNMWNFVDKNEKPTMNISTTTSFSPPNTEMLKNAIVNGYEYRHLMKLIADGQDERIPLQYRFLSLFMVLEEEFKTIGKWDYSKAHDILSPHAEKFYNLGHYKKPLSTLIQIRDRCAHIKSDKDVRGITQLSNKDATTVVNIIPILNDICISILNDICISILNTKSAGKIELRKRKNSK